MFFEMATISPTNGSYSIIQEIHGECQSISPVNNKPQYSKEFKKEAVDLALNGFYIHSPNSKRFRVKNKYAV